MFLWFFFFKQKTAYEMRISDWSSDVCSSDLRFQGIPLEQGAHVHNQVGNPGIKVHRNKTGNPGTERVTESGQYAHGHRKWSEDNQHGRINDLNNENDVYADPQYPNGKGFHYRRCQQLETYLHAVSQFHDGIPNAGKALLNG